MRFLSKILEFSFQSRSRVTLTAIVVCISLVFASSLLQCQTGMEVAAAPAPVDQVDSKESAYEIQRNRIYGQSNPAYREQTGSNVTANEPLLADVYIPQPVTSNHALNNTLRPAIILIHGGSWQRGNRDRMAPIAEGLVTAGFVVVNIEYSLAPRYRFPGQLDECRAAVIWIRENAAQWQVDPARIGAMGYSAGAHLALMLATARRDTRDPARIQAVVAGAPPVDLSRFPANSAMYRLLGAHEEAAPELYRQASPISHVSADDPPAFLYHGRYDWVVPVEQSRLMADRLRAVGVIVEVFESDSGHLTSSPFRNEIPIGLQPAIDFLKRHL